MRITNPDEPVRDGSATIGAQPDIYRIAWASPGLRAAITIGRLIDETAAAYTFVVPWRTTDTFVVPKRLVSALVRPTARDFGIAMAVEACRAP